MKRINLKDRVIWIYLLKFIGVFCLCYFGTLAVIGLSTPGKLYSPFVYHYLDYVSLLRNSLLYGIKWMAALFNFKTFFPGRYIIRVVDGSGITLVYSCLGYGVMSFWIAFIVANTGSFRKKVTWVMGGWILIWIINTIRLSMVLISNNQHWKIPLFDHHTWFNLIAYLGLFLLIWLYDRSSKKVQAT